MDDDGRWRRQGALVDVGRQEDTDQELRIGIHLRRRPQRLSLLAPVKQHDQKKDARKANGARPQPIVP